MCPCWSRSFGSRWFLSLLRPHLHVDSQFLQWQNLVQVVPGIVVSGRPKFLSLKAALIASCFSVWQRYFSQGENRISQSTLAEGMKLILSSSSKSAISSKSGAPSSEDVDVAVVFVDATRALSILTSSMLIVWG